MSDITTLPTYEMNSFCRWVANATLAYFENPDVQERFEKWKKERGEQSGEGEVREII